MPDKERNNKIKKRVIGPYSTEELLNMRHKQEKR